MSHGNKKIYALVLSIVSFSLLIENYCSLVSYAADQQGSISILSIDDIVLFTPEDFDFTPAFAPNSDEATTSYTMLLPNISDEKLSVVDSSEENGFNVTLSVTPLLSSTNAADIIDVNNIAVVTLAETTSAEVDSGESNVPAGAPNVTAPLYCNLDITNSAQTLANTCETVMMPFSRPVTATTTLADNFESNAASVLLTDASGFSSSGTAVIDEDVILYTGVTGNELTGVTQINEAHETGEEVNQYASISTPLTILQDAVTTDTGTYSVGLGFRLTVDDSTKKGLYNGTLTFDLIIL